MIELVELATSVICAAVVIRYACERLRSHRRPYVSEQQRWRRYQVEERRKQERCFGEWWSPP